MSLNDAWKRLVPALSALLLVKNGKESGRPCTGTEVQEMVMFGSGPTGMVLDIALWRQNEIASCLALQRSRSPQT